MGGFAKPDQGRGVQGGLQRHPLSLKLSNCLGNFQNFSELSPVNLFLFILNTGNG